MDDLPSIGLVLIGVIFLTCFLAYYQEGQSAKIMNSFKVSPAVSLSQGMWAEPLCGQSRSDDVSVFGMGNGGLCGYCSHRT